VIIVDIPIGLAPTGARACEIDARRLIGPRRSSVFASPRRSMLNFDLFDNANAWGKANGAGLSKQCWGIVPKIREADQRMSPDLQTRVGEGHPEVAFTRLRGAPCVHSKRTSEGLSERRAALIGAGLSSIDDMLSGLREIHPLKKDFALDDFYDACALALTAQARLEGAAWRLGDGARDERVLMMEIWG
jgi:predicted RNase H-like nuclease